MSDSTTTARTKQTKLIKDAFRELMKGANTAIPGHVLTFDPASQLAQVQIGILRQDLTGAEFAVQPIIEVPVQFPGDDWAIEFQIDPGCEGMIHFSQRCIDGWLQSGGIATNPVARFHNMQDAFFAPGYRSLPNVLPGFQNNGVRLRNRAGSQFVWLKNDGSIFIENGTGHIRLGSDGVVTINGATIPLSGDVITAAGISLNTHIHEGSPTAPTGPITNTGQPVP